MKVILTFLPFLFFLLNSPFSSAQKAIGDWDAHISYTAPIAVVQTGDVIYAATSDALFSYNTADNSLERISRIQGLSSQGITSLAFHQASNSIIIGYLDGDLDILQNNVFFNFPDIKNSAVMGEKRINSIHCRNEFAYLNTGVGLVVLDLQKKEVKDTYHVLPSEFPVTYNQVSVLNDTLFVATSQGVFKARADALNLNNFNFWQQETGLPSGNFLKIGSTGNAIMAAMESANGQTLYMRQNGNWNLTGNVSGLRNIWGNDHQILIAYYNGVARYNESGYLEFVGDFVDSPQVHDAILDEEGNMWVVEEKMGLIKIDPNNVRENFLPTGPLSSRVFKMSFDNDQLLIAGGGAVRPGNWNNNFDNDGFSRKADGNWQTYNWDTAPFFEQNTILDIVDVISRPSDPNHIFAASWFSGLVEVKPGGELILHDETNSALQNWASFTDFCGVGGLAFDDEENLWMTNGHINEGLVVYKPDGEWMNFNINSAAGTEPVVADIMITQQGHIWMLQVRKGFVVYDHKGTISDKSDDEVILLDTRPGHGGLPVIDIHCMAEDLDGEIWVGTNEGIAVFYTPSDVFSNRPGDAQRIIIEQDGNYQYLFERETVLAIAINGANQKWIGTAGSGAFLMSEDGKEQIMHLNTSNSPLPSNIIYNITIDQKTGEVYFATDHGVYSYRGSSTEGASTNLCTSVYPNPVRENYHGPIAVTGLERNAVVKIADIRGNLVKELTSEGGQAIWDGKNNNGERVATGVYMAISSRADGETGCVSKILMIK